MVQIKRLNKADGLRHLLVIAKQCAKILEISHRQPLHRLCFPIRSLVWFCLFMHYSTLLMLQETQKHLKLVQTAAYLTQSACMHQSNHFMLPSPLRSNFGFKHFPFGSCKCRCCRKTMPQNCAYSNCGQIKTDFFLLLEQKNTNDLQVCRFFEDFDGIAAKTVEQAF